MLKPITTSNAPKAVGPYSQAIVASGQQLVFVSGQIPINPQTNVIETSDVREQTRIVLDNLFAVLKASGADLSSVARTTVFLKNMNDFSSVNEVYEQYFSEHKPARACVEVARLPRDVLVEIDAIAII